MTRDELQAMLASIGCEVPQDGSAIAIGNFDGVHHGHRRILESLIRDAREQDVPALVMTFEPHPVTVFGKRPPSAFRLTTSAHRKALLHEAGVDQVVTLPFSRDFAQLEAEAFVETLLTDLLRCRSLHVGHDFNFGRGRRGDPALLERLQGPLGYALCLHDAYLHGGEPISSTRVREALRQGDLLLASELLGRPWSLRGQREAGAGRGRTMGFPTVNLYPEEILPPRFGVYVSRVLLRGREALRAITNVGQRPTFDDGERVSVESFVLDTSPLVQELPEASAFEVQLLDFLRPEQAFPSADALVAQIGKDVERARAWHAEAETR